MTEKILLLAFFPNSATFYYSNDIKSLTKIMFVTLHKLTFSLETTRMYTTALHSSVGKKTEMALTVDLIIKSKWNCTGKWHI